MCLLRYLVSLVTIVKRCDSAFDPVPSAAPRRGVRGTPRMAPRDRQLARNPSVSMTALSPASVPSMPTPRARSPTHYRSRRALDLTFSADASNVLKSGGGTVHAPHAAPYGRSLSSVLEELAVACGFGDPERHTTILKRCDMKLNAVRLTAHTRKACVWS